MESKVRLIIFDLDGTLVDAYPAIISSFNHTLRRMGYPSQDSLIIRRAVGWGDENLLKPFLKRKDLKVALAIYRRHHQKALLRCSRLFPQAKAVLRDLKRKGYRLAVASNRPSRFSRILIRHLGLERYFTYVLCADRVKYGKPHPEILKKIMGRLRLAPPEAIYVGDMTIDAQAGRRAKIKTIIVTTGSSSQAEIKREKPWRAIGRIGDLLKMF